MPDHGASISVEFDMALLSLFGRFKSNSMLSVN